MHNMEPSESCQGQRIGEINLTLKLKDKQNRLEQQLIDIKRARHILEENPILAELHNLLVRIR